MGDFGVLVEDFLLLGDLVVAFLADFEPRPEGVLGDFRDFFPLERDVVDLRRLGAVPSEVGRDFLPGEAEPALEAVPEIETVDPEGVANDSRLAWEYERFRVDLEEVVGREVRSTEEIPSPNLFTYSSCIIGERR